MPQLEQIDTYLSQVIWLVISFAVLYVVMWKGALPRVADVLQERQERIDDDLDRAEKLKSEAEAALEAYEATVGTCRSAGDPARGDGCVRRRGHPPTWRGVG